jgi:hypothetical protein
LIEAFFVKLLIHTLFASLFLTTFAAAKSYDCKFKVRANDRKWIPTSLSIDVDRNDRVWVLGNVIKTDAGRAIEGRETDIIRTRDVFEVETANENMPVDSRRPIAADARRVRYTVSIDPKNLTANLRVVTIVPHFEVFRRVAGTCKIR